MINKIVIDLFFLSILYIIYRFWMVGVKELNLQHLKGEWKDEEEFLKKRQNWDNTISGIIFCLILLMMVII